MNLYLKKTMFFIVLFVILYTHAQAVVAQYTHKWSPNGYYIVNNCKATRDIWPSDKGEAISEFWIAGDQAFWKYHIRRGTSDESYHWYWTDLSGGCVSEYAYNKVGAWGSRKQKQEIVNFKVSNGYATWTEIRPSIYSSGTESRYKCSKRLSLKNWSDPECREISQLPPATLPRSNLPPAEFPQRPPAEIPQRPPAEIPMNSCLDEVRSCLTNCERKYSPRSYSVTTRRQFDQCKENCDRNFAICTGQFHN